MVILGGAVEKYEVIEEINQETMDNSVRKAVLVKL
jgi:hypothetical protein